jgi:hypothetical protein
MVVAVLVHVVILCVCAVLTVLMFSTSLVFYLFMDIWKIKNELINTLGPPILSS